MGVENEKLEQTTRAEQTSLAGLSDPRVTRAAANLSREKLVAEIHEWLATRRRRT